MSTPTPTSAVPEALAEQAEFLRRLARGLLGDAHAAEDVAQEAWVLALERPPKHGANLRGWSARVAERLARRWQRAGRRRAEREQHSARAEALPAAADLAAREELLRRVTDAVLALEEPYRATILLRYYEGLEAREIADSTGIPLATVRSRLQRAHERLRERLDREHGGERGAWASALVALVTDRRALAESASAASVVGGTGALIVGTKTKLAAAAAFVALAGAGAWWSGALAPDPARTEVARVAPAVDAERGGEASRLDANASAPTSDEEQRAALEAPLPPEVPTTASLEIELRWQRTGAPVADCELWIASSALPANASMRVTRTDREGRALVEDLVPGRTVIRSSRGASGLIELAAGERARATLEVPPGFRVRGRVVDAEGEPVGGARVWLSDNFTYNLGYIVGASRADGSFELEDVQEARYIGANADGHAPAHLLFLPDIQAGERSDVEVTLTLNGPGGRLRLAVVGTDGAPASGAYVRVEGSPPATRALPSGKTALANGIAPYVAWTDASGQAEIAGLPLRRAWVRVLAAGYAPHKASFEIEAASSQVQRIVLEREASVHGVISDARGAPLAGASVRINERDESQRYESLLISTRTREDGSYDLRGLPVGRVPLLASLEKLGSASTVLELAPGADARWDAAISAGRVVAGRALDAKEEPLAGWTVRATDRTGYEWRKQAATDAEGAFSFVDCPAGTLWIELHRDAEQWIPTASQRLAGDESEVLFRVEDDRMPDGSIEGRLVHTDGSPARANIGFMLAGARSGRGFDTDADGRFRVERLPPGRYELTARPDEHPAFRAAVVELRTSEALDIGTLRLDTPGRVLITVDGVPPATQSAFEIFLFEPLFDDRERTGIAIASMLARDADAGVLLHPGRYLLRAIAGREHANEERELTIASGAELTIDLSPRPGRRCSFDVVVAEGAEMPESVRVRLEDETGRKLFEMETSQAQGRLVGIGTQLAPGRYVFEAEAPDGRRASGTLEVVLADDDAACRLVVTLE